MSDHEKMINRETKNRAQQGDIITSIQGTMHTCTYSHSGIFVHDAFLFVSCWFMWQPVVELCALGTVAGAFGAVSGT